MKKSKPIVLLYCLQNVDGISSDAATFVSSYLHRKPPITLSLNLFWLDPLLYDFQNLFRLDLSLFDHEKIDKKPRSKFL